MRPLIASTLLAVLLLAGGAVRRHPPVKPVPRRTKTTHALAPAPPANVPAAILPKDPVLGRWSGTATSAGATLELSVRIHRDGGAIAADLTSADLLLLDQPLDHVRRTAHGIAFDTPDAQALHVDAALAGDTLRAVVAIPAVAGIANAGQAAMVLVLGRTTEAAPPPYSTREVAFVSGGTRLAGTVFLPEGAGAPLPAVTLLQGSSSNLRRESRFYADHFARAGFAVLAFDKRGSGESGGDYGAATYDRLADDAAAAVETLRHVAGVDSGRVGIWGLSQGSFLAPFVARRVPALRFIVAVSAPGLPVGECATYQDSVRLASAGFDAADVRRTSTLNRRLYDWLRGGGNAGETAALLAEAADTPWRRASSLPVRLPAGPALEGWYWRGRTVDPAAAWRDVGVPVLALYGAADELMPVRANARAVDRALHSGRNHDVTVKTFPAANHVLRRLPLVAGGRWDWPRAAPGSLELETSWMTQHVASAPVASGH